jgi:kynureninase
MRTDARVARFGGAKTSHGLGSVTVLPHATIARLWSLQVTAGQTVTLQLPGHDLSVGYQFSVLNAGTGSDGEIMVLDASMAELTLDGPLGGGSLLPVEAMAHCFYLGSGAWSVWAIAARAPRTVIS